VEDALSRLVSKLSAANREFSQFAYVASHDLQEPLRMISSYLQLLSKRYTGHIDKDADEFINYAVDGANRLQRMINDLLTFSRVGTRGKLFAKTDVGVVLGFALTNLEIAIEEAHAKVTHSDLPTVKADEVQLLQLFQNLIENAIKFRSDKPLAIHVSAERGDGEWIFSVKDNGIGIDPHYRDRLFVIFQRLHSAAKYPGTGIGLALCKRIVERHSGRIWIESELGKGSTLRFTIPDKKEEPEAGTLEGEVISPDEQKKDTE
jgi:light-regulated signal transduction histidine kinase (bacteriophytochrome)